MLWTPATQNTGETVQDSQTAHRAQSVPVQSNSLRSGWGHTMRQTCTNSQGDSRRPQQSEKPQSGPYLLGENFKRLYRVAHCIHKKKNKKKSLLFYVFSLTVSVVVWLLVGVRVCMCVCICFRACMGIGVIRKGKRVQWVTG